MRARLLRGGAWAMLGLLVACGGDDPDVPSDGGGAVDAAGAGDVRLADGVVLRDVALLQSVKLPLVTGGVAVTPPVPPIAGKAGALRLYLDPVTPAREVTAELVLDGAVVTQAHSTSTASDEGTPGSVITLPVPDDALAVGARWSVRLRADDGVAVPVGTASTARWPRDGSDAALDVVPPTRLRVTLVPLRYDTDGSGRLPELGDAQLASYRDLLGALYPATEVELTTRAAVPWDGALTIPGNVNFGDVNDLLIDLRAADGVDADVYYYALVAPAATFSAYCGGSCVTGQSYVVEDPGAAAFRVGAGLGFAGEDSAWTLAHELGHMHGRSHAPCGVGSSDPAYPHDGGVTGGWGYDARAGTLRPPTATDFMGYCDDPWVSAYSYAAYYARVRAVATTAARALSGPPRLSSCGERLAP